MTSLPEFALSVRQPWAYGIIHAGKDIENRSWNRRFAAGRAGLDFRGRIAVHAAKGMTRDEYEDAVHSFRIAGAKCPPAHELLRGGIIGTVTIVDVVRQSSSPWFYGPNGLVLRDPEPVEFIPCTGMLGFFRWLPNPEASADPPAKWMLPPGERPATKVEMAQNQGSLL